MPDANGRFRGISIPELPWLRDKPKPPDAGAVIQMLSEQDYLDLHALSPSKRQALLAELDAEATRLNRTKGPKP